MIYGGDSTKSFPRPLGGIGIVEFGVWHARTVASAILADIGAEVVKVEALTGYPARHFGSVGHHHHCSLGTVRIPGYPVVFRANLARTRASAPDMSKHTDSVLSELGYSSQSTDKQKTANSTE
jgi:crotonobetainyl-CoA:carnitine CoA-transferase CaiB-like acyl-CoA transferase